MRYNLKRCFFIEVYLLKTIDNSNKEEFYTLYEKSDLIGTLNNKEIILNSYFEKYKKEIDNKTCKIKIIEVLN